VTKKADRKCSGVTFVHYRGVAVSEKTNGFSKTATPESPEGELWETLESSNF
jgi:hypothetical protein